MTTPSQSFPDLPGASQAEAMKVVAHASTDWMRSITETELELIPNVSSDSGRRDRCRMLYRIPLVRLSDVQALAGEVERLRAEVAALTADAERYRWLREQDWFSGPLCVLRDPKRVLTRGIGLGADCPSRHRLDAALDASRAVATQEAKS